MKASIITMTTTYNYGATIQAYALQEFVKKLGCKCDIIDHMSSEKTHKKIRLNDFSKPNLIRIPYKFLLEKGYSRFEKFYEQHMNMSKRYATYEQLKSNPPDSDVFITGSDQVWNPSDPKLNRFLLEFVPDNKRKISYAASIGNSTLPDEKKQTYIEALKRFDAISVREEEAHDMISPLTEKDVNINCDPAFLLNKEEWRALESPVKGLKENEYILCYMIHLPEWINEWISELKKKTSLKIVFVGLNGYRSVNCDRYVRDAGIGEFLWLIDNAAMVVSSSFHGNVFSLIFGKTLISTPDKKRPDRIHNLLRIFNETRREVYDKNDKIVFEPVDIEFIERVIKNEQKKAEDYLSNVFSNA